MKTILVDAVNTFVVTGIVDTRLHDLLETYPNRKIIVTNANDDQLIEFGLVDMPYEIFSMKHQPDKVDPLYFSALLKKHDLKANDVVYFEHNNDAVQSARSVGITAYHFDHQVRDFESLKSFLDGNLG